MRTTRWTLSVTFLAAVTAARATGPLGLAVTQPPAVQTGEAVPREVRQIYDRGLQFPAASQSQDGTWDGVRPELVDTESARRSGFRPRTVRNA
jgi:hypothetical protein